ncbi:stimulated by retinoic acid gene 6 protein-like isoform X2 [Ostrea edulis]|nr:stimulated by retinoic acid gene 6 protein-like isoform X2 [Ostrea edulis]XP_048779073.2 stimulated by retinoic acid gene 6 protein-like isoform X2 [Ostrea edulis]XP_048779075.2 stimulated by retinoic acid gene 6 protein-like isoform X2 [Ostrea edulis]XP_056015560.1 stimulated by retinoic acid gene 6 protein-like isoform X2 [Ostrea edulis]
MQNQTVQPDSAEPDLCSQINTALFTEFGMVIYAIVAIVIICFFEKRRFKADVCHGRPGLPLPINFLDGTSNSVANAAAFGCTLDHIIIYLFFGPVRITEHPWLSFLSMFITCFMMSIAFYPIFASLNTSSRLFGSIIGFLYILLLSLVDIGRFYVCTTETWLWSIKFITIISEAYLLILFIYRCVTALFKKSVNSKEPLVKIDQMMHVMELLQTPVSTSTSENIKEKIIKNTERAVHEAKLCCLHKSLYRCTTRTLVINTIVFMIFYYIFVIIVANIDDAGEIIDQLPDTNPSWFKKTLKTFIQVIRVSFTIANILSAVYLVANMIFIYRSQRQHVIQMWKGDRSFIPVNCTQSHSDMLVKNLMYAGNQAAHLLGGYLIFQYVVVVLCMVIAYGFVLPIMKEVPSLFLKPLAFSIPGVVFMFVFRAVLRIISSKFFLQNHYLSSDNGETWEKVLALDNRRVYQNLSFFLFFYYMLIGLYRCLYRVVISVILSLFYFSRMDRPILFPGFEHLDIGYMTYLGFLEVELHHCHPVVVVFCDQIIKSVKSKSFTSQERQTRIETDVYENDVYVFSNVHTARVKNKWLKMRTLIKNQSLCKDSKTNIFFQHPLHAKKTFVGCKAEIKSSEV